MLPEPAGSAFEITCARGSCRANAIRAVRIPLEFSLSFVLERSRWDMLRGKPTTEADFVAHFQREKRILVICFRDAPTQRGAMARLSCFLESPTSFGCVFSESQFAALRERSREYQGHNASVDGVLRFVAAMSEHGFPLNALESRVVAELHAVGAMTYSKVLRRLELRLPVYLITHLPLSSDSTGNTLAHEFKHALYYLDSGYRDDVAAMWATLNRDTQVRLEQFVHSLGYHPSLSLDEFQAYFCTEPATFWPKDVRATISELLRSHETVKLRRLT